MVRCGDSASLGDVAEQHRRDSSDLPTIEPVPTGVWTIYLQSVDERQVLLRSQNWRVPARSGWSCQ